MLAGLLFANADADDRPDALVATLPFGGATLIEFQARMLIAAGAAQIVVAVTRTTPELIGAINRIARRGVAVDMVRTAAEALARLHPLATILVLADGLITSEAMIARMAEGEDDAVLVTDAAGSTDRFERIDATTFWAGIARIGPRRLADAARLPEDYDLQSTLLRIVAQAGPVRVLLASGDSAGHGIERDSARLAQRGRGVLSGRLAARKAWIDRFVFAPLARWVLPPLLARRVPAAALSAIGGVLTVAGGAALAVGWPIAGLVLAVLAVVAFDLGQSLSWLRGEERQARMQGAAVIAVVVLACGLTGWLISRDTGTATALLAAAALFVSGTLLERASGAARRGWWGSPPAYLFVLTGLTIARMPLVGLIVAAAYAAASLADAVERLRQP
jgi:hypothetical protein